MLRDFLIGKEQIPSLKVYKQAMVRGQVALLTGFIALAYILIDSFYEVYHNIPALVGYSMFCFIAFYLNRLRHFTFSTLLLLISSNLLIFHFATSEPMSAGVSIFFIPIILGSMALFGFSQWYWAVFSIVISFTLFLAAYLTDFSFTPNRPFSYEYERVIFITNYVTAGTLSTLIVYFLIKLNYHAEKVLRDNEARLVQQNELLAKANTELDYFVYSVSHDLRAPLSSVLGLLGLAEKTENHEELRSYLDMMRNRVDALEKFIRDIIDYSRNSRLELNNDPINLKELIKEVMDGLRFTDEMALINISTQIPDSLTVKSDKVRFKIILNNLISNAIKYYDPSKPDNQVMIIAHHENGFLHIQVKDNGIGIKEQFIPKIFDMFFRATEKSKGSGLGLYIAHEASKKIGGRLTVESQHGTGSTFTLQVPA